MQGTVHWAQHCKAHASLRELLRLGVRSHANREAWEGCTPMMLAAAQNDTYGMGILMDHAELLGGEERVVALVNAHQASGSRMRASALHHAADAAADLCTQLLLDRGARVEVRSSKGETALVVARRRAAIAEKGPNRETFDAAVRCGEILEEAMAKAKEERRTAHGFGLPSPPAGSGTGKRKGKGMGKGLMAASRTASDSGAYTGGETGGESDYYGAPSPRVGGGGYTDGSYTDGGYTDGGYTDGGYALTEAEDDDYWERPLGELLALVSPELRAEISAQMAAEGLDVTTGGHVARSSSGDDRFASDAPPGESMAGATEAQPAAAWTPMELSR